MREQGIYFDDFFDFFSVELNCSKYEVKNIFRNNTKNKIMEIFKKSSPSFFYNDVRLNKPIKDSQGNVLLYEDVEFTSYLPSIVDWIIKNPEKNISAFEFQATDSLIKYYKGQILTHIRNLISNLKNPKNNKYFPVLNKCEAIESLRYIESAVENLIGHVLDKPQGINLMIKSITVRVDKSSPLEYSINCAFIAMAIMQMITNDKKKVENIGFAALFQNISDMTNWEYDKVHPVVSSKIAEELYLPEEVVFTILNHHSLEDEDGILPVFNKKKKLPDLLVVLSNVNLFMDVCNFYNLNCDELEIIKVLWVAANNGFASSDVVRTVAELFLDKSSYKYLINHLKILKKCEYHPVLWNIKGNTIPSKFICQKESCKDITTHTTIITKDITYYHRNRVIVSINKGTYYSCGKLEVLKKHIKELID